MNLLYSTRFLNSIILALHQFSLLLPYSAQSPLRLVIVYILVTHLKNMLENFRILIFIIFLFLFILVVAWCIALFFLSCACLSWGRQREFILNNHFQLKDFFEKILGYVIGKAD